MRSIGTGWHVKDSELNRPEFKHFAIHHYMEEMYKVQAETRALQQKILGLLESCNCMSCGDHIDRWER